MSEQNEKTSRLTLKSLKEMIDTLNEELKKRDALIEELTKTVSNLPPPSHVTPLMFCTEKEVRIGSYQSGTNHIRDLYGKSFTGMFRFKKDDENVPTSKNGYQRQFLAPISNLNIKQVVSITGARLHRSGVLTDPVEEYWISFGKNIYCEFSKEIRGKIENLCANINESFNNDLYQINLLYTKWGA